jgi:hypothetical protein
MDIRPTFVADSEPTVLVRPRQRPLYRPAGLTQPALVVDPLLRQHRLDPDRYGLTAESATNSTVIIRRVASRMTLL